MFTSPRAPVEEIPQGTCRWTFVTQRVFGIIRVQRPPLTSFLATAKPYSNAGTHIEQNKPQRESVYAKNSFNEADKCLSHASVTKVSPIRIKQSNEKCIHSELNCFGTCRSSSVSPFMSVSNRPTGTVPPPPKPRLQQRRQLKCQTFLSQLSHIPHTCQGLVHSRNVRRSGHQRLTFDCAFKLHVAGKRFPRGRLNSPSDS